MVVESKIDWSKFVGDWEDFLEPFLESNEYDKISSELRKQLKIDKLCIVPSPQNIFRAFKECPFHALHTIIIGDCPYTTRTIDQFIKADGIAFSAKDSVNCPIPLNHIFEAIDTQIYNGNWFNSRVFHNEAGEVSYDLASWANQGILLLNSSLTSVLYKGNFHKELWDSFVSYLLIKINYTFDSLGVILMGKEAQKHKQYLTNRSYGLFECEHPDEAISKNRKWHSELVFKDLVDFQLLNNNIEIKW